VLRGSDVGHSAVFSPHPLMRVMRRVLVPLLQLRPVRDAVLARADELDVGYRDSSIVTETGRPRGLTDRFRFHRGPRPGERAPDARGRDAVGRPVRLFDHFRGPHATLLLFGADARTALPRTALLGGEEVRRCYVVAAGPVPAELRGEAVLVDVDGEARRLYGAPPGAVYLVRPDGHVGYRSPYPVEGPLREHLRALSATPAVPDGASVRVGGQRPDPG
jgi:hypothetical protein